MNDNTATHLSKLFRELQKGSGGPLRQDLGPGPMPAAASRASKDPAAAFDEFILVEPVAGTKIVKAWDRLLGRWVALKIWPAGAADPIDNARLVHPNIVPVHRVGEAAGRLYLATAWIEGASLDRMKPTARVAVEAVRIAALVVQWARQKSIATRALSPADLMIDRHGALWVLNVALGDDPDPMASLRALLKQLAGNGDLSKIPGDTPELFAESLRKVLDGRETKGVLGRAAAWLKSGGR